ncbi:hypothetical protein KA405_04770 [Patescibacteria group bacterium]|nr:hypothetical protein [Patescibacteria group bacterium]
MLFVASEIYDVFMAKLKDAIEKITIGMSYGWYTTVHDDKVHYDPKVIPFITPLPEPGKVAAMKAFIDEALDK